MAYDPSRQYRSSSALTPRWSLVFATLSFLLVFLSGYLYGQSDAMQGRHVFSGVLKSVGIDPGRVGVFAVAPANVDLSEADRQRLHAFWETWNYVDQEFFPQEAVNHERMVHGAIRGMLETLGDPNTVFLSPRQRELADSDLRGSFDGVGIQVEAKDGAIRVVAPIDGSPAQDAGMLPGDVLTHVDDTDVRSHSISDVVPLIRGTRGTPVRLTIERTGSDRPLQFTLTRAEIRVQTVRARMLDHNVAYVRIASFNRTAPADLSDRLKEVMDQQPTALVLDLRSNPGGFVTSAVEMTSQFLSDGVVFYQRNADGEDQEFRTRGQGQATSLPIAVLVNRGTASAAEIAAAALRDADRAVLIGEKTFGKGTVQSVRQLSDHSGLRITSAQWLTPEKAPIHGQGLDPDITVESQITPSQENDPAITEAVRYLIQTHAQQPVAQTLP